MEIWCWHGYRHRGRLLGRLGFLGDVGARHVGGLAPLEHSEFVGVIAGCWRGVGEGGFTGDVSDPSAVATDALVRGVVGAEYEFYVVAIQGCGAFDGHRHGIFDHDWARSAGDVGGSAASC